jgi:hypothetical protein
MPRRQIQLRPLLPLASYPPQWRVDGFQIAGLVGWVISYASHGPLNRAEKGSELLVPSVHQR